MSHASLFVITKSNPRFSTQSSVLLIFSTKYNNGCVIAIDEFLWYLVSHLIIISLFHYFIKLKLQKLSSLLVWLVAINEDLVIIIGYNMLRLSLRAGCWSIDVSVYFYRFLFEWLSRLLLLGIFWLILLLGLNFNVDFSSLFILIIWNSMGLNKINSLICII